VKLVAMAIVADFERPFEEFVDGRVLTVEFAVLVMLELSRLDVVRGEVVVEALVTFVIALVLMISVTKVVT
jgi:hypothetical protein